MNLLQINTTDKRGGAAQIAWDLKEELIKRGSISSMFVADKLTNDNNVISIKRSDTRKALSIIFSCDFYNSKSILKTQEFKDSDVVHCHNLHGRYFNLNDLIAICVKKPIVWTLHDEWAITPHSVYTLQNEKMIDGFFQCDDKNMPERFLFNLEKKQRAIKRNIYNSCNLNVVTPCLWLKKRVERSFLGNKNVRVIYNGINTENFCILDKMAARASLGLPLDKKIVLILSDGGKDAPRWKGWEYARKVIDYFKKDPLLLFVCVGNKEIYSNESNLKYFGLIKHEELSKYYSASDIYLHTSLADNFPLVILEAMACGLPIVSFDVGGVKEVAEHLINGYIAEYKNEFELIKGINYIKDMNSNKISIISYVSSKKVRDEFNLSKMIDQYEKLYQELSRNNK